jgi:hypothetical protein
MRQLSAILSAVVMFACVAAGLRAADPVRTIKDGALDQIRLFVDKLPDTKAVVIRPFSATDDDIVEGEKKEETKTMQKDAPKLLADEFVSQVKDKGCFTTSIVVDQGKTPPNNALVVEGKFVELDPGSRAKRYLVGFGSGKSAVKVTGTVKTADGKLLAEFEQRRVGSMGFAGGDSIKKLTADVKNIGEDLAKFVTEWAKGKKLD